MPDLFATLTQSVSDGAPEIEHLLNARAVRILQERRAVDPFRVDLSPPPYKARPVPTPTARWTCPQWQAFTEGVGGECRRTRGAAESGSKGISGAHSLSHQDSLCAQAQAGEGIMKGEYRITVSTDRHGLGVVKISQSGECTPEHGNYLLRGTAQALWDHADRLETQVQCKTCAHRPDKPGEYCGGSGRYPPSHDAWIFCGWWARRAVVLAFDSVKSRSGGAA